MSKLTDGHIAQIRSMRNEEKNTYEEIRDFFQEKYKIRLYDCDIAKVMRGEVLSGKPKRRYIKKGSRKVRPGRLTPREDLPKQEEEGEVFVNHIREAYEIHKRGFFVRVAEAIKS